MAAWHGVVVASALPLHEDQSVDYAGFADHVRWLAENGCHGIAPSGSLGEYQTLTPDERSLVVETAVAAAPEGFSVVPGTGAYGSRESRHWAEQARDAGAHAVLQLPPNAYRTDERAVLEHFREVAKAGIPVVAYNNPHDTKTDLTPRVLAQLFEEGSIVAVKEFSGDVRRIYEIAELAPELDVLVGTDDVVVELAIAGATGWIAGYPNALPKSCVELWEAAAAKDLEKALPLYRDLHPLLRWDSKPEFVQAIKYSMDLVGRRGGPCRAPRLPLTGDALADVRAATEKAIASGYR